MMTKQSDNNELVMAELDAVVGGGKSGGGGKGAEFAESSAAHRDRIRDAVLDFLHKTSEIKGTY